MFPRFYKVAIDGREMSVAASTREAAEKIAARRVADARKKGRTPQIAAGGLVWAHARAPANVVALARGAPR